MRGGNPPTPLRLHFPSCPFSLLSSGHHVISDYNVKAEGMQLLQSQGAILELFSCASISSLYPLAPVSHSLPIAACWAEFWTGKASRLARLLSIICTVLGKSSQMANISVIGSSILSPQLRIWVPREVFRWGGLLWFGPNHKLEPRGLFRATCGCTKVLWDCLLFPQGGQFCLYLRLWDSVVWQLAIVSRWVGRGNEL